MLCVPRPIVFLSLRFVFKKTIVFCWVQFLSVILTIDNQLLRVGLFWLLESTKKLRRMIYMSHFLSSERSRTCISTSTGELDSSRFGSILIINASAFYIIQLFFILLYCIQILGIDTLLDIMDKIGVLSFSIIQ